MKEVKLTRGQITIVDDETYKWLQSRTTPIMNLRQKWMSAKRYNQYGKFYAVRNGSPLEKRNRYYLHNEIWEHYNGPIPDGYEVDHINRNSLDNRIENLRLVTRTENNMNMTPRTGGTSEYKGVYLPKDRRYWTVRLVREYIGYFADEKDAAYCYDYYAYKKFGDIVNLNLPRQSEEFYQDVLSRNRKRNKK